VAGSLAGGAVGDTPEERLRHALIRAGLGAIASPALMRAAVDLTRKAASSLAEKAQPGGAFAWLRKQASILAPEEGALGKIPHGEGVRVPVPRATTFDQPPLHPSSASGHLDLGRQRLRRGEPAHGRVYLRIVDDIQPLGQGGHRTLESLEALFHTLRRVPIEAEQLPVGGRIGV
jgi:hypothetical protein